MRIGIVEDHPLFRDAIQRAVEAEGIEVLFAVSTLEASTRSLGALAPDRRPEIVLVDIELPDGDGIDHAAASMKRTPGGSKWIVLTSHADATQQERARRAGCAAFLAKAAHARDVIETLRRVAAGEMVFEYSDGRTPVVSLSPRELDVLALVAEGFTNGEISDALGISVETVKTVLGHARAKLGAADRAHAVALAFEAGLLRKWR